MRAIRFNAYGDSEVLYLGEVEVPHAGPGQVRIRVRAAGVNPTDWKRRKGLLSAVEPVAFPTGIGVEAAGIVDEVGAGVQGYGVGEAVFGYGSNTLADYAVLTHWARKPDSMPFEIAAGLSVTGETAWRALDDLAVRAGETLLISGAAGGIGAAAVQLARLRGANVIGTSSPGNQGLLRILGATPTTYGPGLIERVRAIAPLGVDAALDVAGSGIIKELIEITGHADRVVSVADFSAEALGARFSKGPPREPERVLSRIAQLWVEGKFVARVQQVFSMEQAAQSHRLSESGHASGKLIIHVSGA